MKHISLILLFAFGAFLTSEAQTIGNTTIKNADHFIWFGLDFSALQCVGREGFPDAKDVVNSKVPAWNDLMIAEHEKFNINSFFQKKEFHYDLTSVEKQNTKLQSDALVVDKAIDFDRDQIAAMILNYSSEEYNDGLGLVFIIEKFDKNENLANIHVTFFDIATKEIVQVIKYTGAPRGFGLRNFWAGAIYNVMDQLGDDYKKWLKKNK